MNTVFALAGVVIKELYRRKDFYVLFVLTAVITLLMGAVNFFNDPKIVRYLKEICLLLIWISALVVAIGTAARQIPAEKENRTIFPLLAKPVTRWQVVLGKFFGCWLACGIALLIFYLFFAVVSEARSHRDSPSDQASAQITTHDAHDHDAHKHDASCEKEHHDEPDAAWTGFRYMQALWLHWVMLAVVIAMVLLGSVIFAAPSSNATIIFVGIAGILFLGEHLNKIALRQTQPAQTLLQLIYFSIPHLEWYDIRDCVIYESAPPGWGVCGLATLYGAVYTSLFLLLAWLAFRRKGLTQ